MNLKRAILICKTPESHRYLWPEDQSVKKRGLAQTKSMVLDCEVLGLEFLTELLENIKELKKYKKHEEGAVNYYEYLSFENGTEEALLKELAEFCLSKQFVNQKIEEVNK
jgi:hypothetical protein